MMLPSPSVVNSAAEIAVNSKIETSSAGQAHAVGKQPAKAQ